jgi:hypothetical protein
MCRDRGDESAMPRVQNIPRALDEVECACGRCSICVFTTSFFFIVLLFQITEVPCIFASDGVLVCVCVCVLSHWVHAAIVEVLDLPSLKWSSHWSLGLFPASVEASLLALIAASLASWLAVPR